MSCLAFYVDTDDPNMELPLSPRTTPFYLTVCTDKDRTENSLSCRHKIFFSFEYKSMSKNVFPEHKYVVYYM